MTQPGLFQRMREAADRMRAEHDRKATIRKRQISAAKLLYAPERVGEQPIVVSQAQYDSFNVRNVSYGSITRLPKRPDNADTYCRHCKTFMWSYEVIPGVYITQHKKKPQEMPVPICPYCNEICTISDLGDGSEN